MRTRSIDKLPERYKELWWKIYGDVFDETGRANVAAAQAWDVVDKEMGRVRQRRTK